MLLERAIATFLKLERAEKTNHSYGVFLNRRLLAALGPCAIEDVSYDGLVDFTYHLRQEVAPSSYQRYLRIVKAFFKWAVEVGYISVSPATALKSRNVRRDHSVSRAMPLPVLQTLLDDLSSNRRDYAITLFLAETACRCGAVARLTISNVNLDECCANVIEKGSQSKVVRFSPLTADALRAWLLVRPQANHDFVFTVIWGKQKWRPMSPGAVTAMIRRNSEKVAAKGYGSHSIRHWAAEALVQSGESAHAVKQKLNHDRLETTLDYYFPPDDDTLVRKATSLLAQQLAPKITPPPNILVLDKVS